MFRLYPDLWTAGLCAVSMTVYAAVGLALAFVR